MNAEEKLEQINSNHPDFYEKFKRLFAESSDGSCFEWLGFGICAGDRLGIEANIQYSPVRLQFLLSQVNDNAIRCCINVRPRADKLNGNISTIDSTAFKALINSPNHYGPVANIRDIEKSPYFKPFGHLEPDQVNQTDVYFDAININIVEEVKTCPACKYVTKLNISEAVVLILKQLCLCGNRLKTKTKTKTKTKNKKIKVIIKIK
jgi:hypothetical protein